jgi:hypothetical protein
MSLCVSLEPAHEQGVIHPRKEFLMSSATLYRVSGLALLPGAVLTIIPGILSLVFASGTFALALAWMFACGAVLLLLGLPGVAARQASRAGWLGFVGFLLTFLSWLLLAGFTAVVRLIIFPWLAVHAPQVGEQMFTTDSALSVYTYVQLALSVLGGVLLGIATMRARVFSRWAGLLLVVGAVLDPVGFVSGLVGTLASVLLTLGLGWMGYALLTAKGEGEAVPQPVPAS